MRHLRRIRRHRKAETVTVRDSDPTTLRILDTAIGVMVDFGIARTSVELVGEIADVSEEAIYRRWPARQDLVNAALARELNRLCSNAFDAAARGAPVFEDIVIDAFSRLVWSVLSHPLLDREMGTESDAADALLTVPAAPVMRTAVIVIAKYLRHTAERTELRLDDPDAMADILVRLAHSMLVVPHPGQPLTSRAHVDEYLRRYALPVVAATARSAAARLEASTADDISHQPGRGRSIPEVVTAALIAVLIGSAAVTAVHVQPASSPATPREMNDEHPQPISSTTVAPPTTIAPVSVPAPVVSATSDETSPPAPAPIAVSAPAPTEDAPRTVVPEEIRDDEGQMRGRRLPPGAGLPPPPMAPPPSRVPPDRAGVPSRPAPSAGSPVGGARPPRRGPAGHPTAGPR